MLAGREVFPKIPWKRTFCWRDHLLNLCLSECLLQNSISLHLEIGKKKWQKCSLYQQSSLLHTSTPKYPFLAGEEFSSFCKSPRCQLYRCKNLLKRVVRITQIQSESWLEAKENSFALLIFFFFLIYPHQSIIKISQLQLRLPQEFIKTRERLVAKFAEYLHNLLWFKMAAATVSDAGWFPIPDPFVRF